MYRKSTFILVIFIFVLASLSIRANETVNTTSEIADVGVDLTSIYFYPKIENNGFTLTISKPSGEVVAFNFKDWTTPKIELSDELIKSFPDGLYSYELKAISVEKNKMRNDEDGFRAKNKLEIEGTKKFLSGNFSIKDGMFVIPEKEDMNNGENVIAKGESADTPVTNDVLHYDDVIATGSLCVGFDCIDGESFGYDTIKLKENNLQLAFEDTSIGTFPGVDWLIKVNDSTSGGASYFAVQDKTNSKTPFKIEANAPNNSLYVEDYGRVGLGTSIPYVELHIVDGDSPTVRLDQDGTSGWAAQSWDLCGNETNFFLRDVTNGSKLCFRVQPNTPSNTLCLRNTGNVGIGTWSPEYKLEVETTGENAAIVTQRTDGAINYMNSTATYGNFGTVSDHPLRLAVNGVWRVRFDNDNSLTMKNGATCTAAGVWTNNSSRELKENIEDLTLDEAEETLENLKPVKYNYKVDKSENYVGFIAEDVPDSVAMNDRKHLVAMDIVGVLTKVVKQQQKTIEELNKRLEKLENKK